MTDGLVTRRQEGAIAWVTLNRPDRLNTLNAASRQGRMSQIRSRVTRVASWRALPGETRVLVGIRMPATSFNERCH